MKQSIQSIQTIPDFDSLIAKNTLEKDPRENPLDVPGVGEQAPRDPWAHRSEGMRCKTCMWFVHKVESGNGRCRRHAPTMSGYPVVFPTDWCGDHKLP
jgi:hypothetical protein